MSRHERTEFECRIIGSLFPNKPRGLGRLIDAIANAYSGDERMIDRTNVRVQHSATTLKKVILIAVSDEAGEVLLQESML